MCHLCGGNICAGTGACTTIINHAPEVMKISYSYTSNLISIFQAYVAAIFSSTRYYLSNTINYFILRKTS